MESLEQLGLGSILRVFLYQVLYAWIFQGIPTLCLVLLKDYVLGSVNQFEVQEDGQHIFSHYTPQLGPLQKSDSEIISSCGRTSIAL